MTRQLLRPILVLFAALALAACETVPDNDADHYGSYVTMADGEYTIPAVDHKYLLEPNHRQLVYYTAADRPGTIVVDPHAKFLYYVLEDGIAVRYPIAVGREGRGFTGGATVGDKREWPGWTPTANMLRTEPEVYRGFERGVPGGLASPLGARALYLYRGGRDTRYRIHGTNDLGSIGNSGSAGCIRLFNQDIIDLYNRVERGARVRVRSYEESVAMEGEAMANRGVELPPTIVPPDVIYDFVAEDEARRAAQGN